MIQMKSLCLMCCVLGLTAWGCGDDSDSGSSDVDARVGAGGQQMGAGSAGDDGMAGEDGEAGETGSAGEMGTAGEEGPEELECMPHNDMCPDGQYCQYTDDGLRCIDDGDVAPDPQNHSEPDCPTGVCSRGGICYDEAPGEPLGGLRCYRPCDPAQVGMAGPDVCMNGRKTCRQATDADGNALPFTYCSY